MREDKEAALEIRKKICDSMVAWGLEKKETQEVLNYMERNGFIEISAPKEQERPMQNIDIRVSHFGDYSAVSRKNGNIVYNIKNAMWAVLETGVQMGDCIKCVANQQLTKLDFVKLILAAISIVSLRKIKINDTASFMLAVLWKERHLYNENFTLDEGLHIINRRLSEEERAIMSELEYNKNLDYLSKIGCIEIADDKIFLIEQIRIKY